MDNITYWTEFWQKGDTIIPLWVSKYGNKRMTLPEMECLGAPVPSIKDEIVYKEWCSENNKDYLPPLHLMEN